MKFYITAILSFVISSPNAQQNSSIVRITNIIDAYPMPTPDGKKIVFQSNRSGNFEIYTINADGTGIQQLTHQNTFDGCPQWSPDGKKIVFVSERDDPDSDIYLMDANGSNVQRLTFTKGDDSHPHWSADGQKIIFNSARTTADITLPWNKQYLEIFEMDTEGKNVRQLTHLKSISTYPSYSPDGKKISFRHVTDSPAFEWDLKITSRNSEVFIADADGSNPKNISVNAAFDGWPCWSPDSKYLVYASNRNGKAYESQLFVCEIAANSTWQITFGPGGFAQPWWGIADSKKIFAYQVFEGAGFEYGNICTVAVSLPVSK